MTKNKKKLRRVERRYSVTKSAQTLVLAGILLAGGVTGAMAANPNWENGHTIASGVTVTSEAGTINLSGTLVNNGTLEIIQSSGLDGTAADASNVVLNNGSTTTVGGWIGVHTIDVQKGATVNLTGTASAAWESAAHLGGYEGLTVNGAVNMGVNSEMFIGRNSYNANEGNGFTLAIGDGANIVMEGTSAGTVFDGNAAHIWAGSPDGKMISGDTSKDMPKNLLSITGGTITVSKDKYGVISSQVTEMSGGELAVNGNLLIQSNAGKKGDSGTIVYAGAKTGKFTLSGGTINVAAGGVVYAPQMHFTQDGGTVTVKGKFYTNKDNITWNYTDSSYTLKNGNLIIEGNGNANGDGTLQAGNLAIEGGTVLVSGVKSANWAHSPTLGGYGVENGNKTEITGGSVTLGNNGVLFAGVDNTSSNGQLNINNGAQVILDGASGQGGIIYAASADAYSGSHSGANYAVVLNISGTNTAVTVNEGKEGYILARETNLSDGAQLNVNGKLTVAGKAAKGGTVAAGITADSITTKGGNFNLTGGTVNVGTAGTLDFATGAVDLNISGGVLNTPTMTIVSTAAAEIPKGLYAQKVNITNTGTLKTDGLSINAANLVDTADAAGELGVAGTGTLHVNGTLALTDLSANYTSTHTGAVIAKKVTLNTPESHGYIQNTGSLTFLGTGAGASFLEAKDLTVQGTGTVNLGTTAKGYTTNGGTYAGKVSVTGGNLNVAAGNWKLTHADGLVQSNGAIAIAGGNLTVNKFNQATNGTTTIGGDAAGILKVTGNTAADFTHKVANGVTVNSAGALDAQANALGTLAGNVFTMADNTNNKQFVVNSNGTLVLRWADGTELNNDALASIKTALLTSGSAGIIKHEGAKLNITADGTGNLADTITDSTASSAGTLLDTTVGVGTSGGSGTVNGGYGTPHLTVDLGSSTSGNLTVKNDTTLTGANGSLVDVKGSSTAKAEDVNFTLDGGSSLNLGNVTEAAGSGTIGNVALATGNLNATNGDFTVGDVSGANGTLQATAATTGTTTLTTGKINVGTIESGAHATINATDTVNVKDVALTGGTLQALESGKATITIGAGGSLTLTNGATVKAGDTLTIKDVNGTSITIDGGNLVAGTTIDATGKDLVVAAGGLSVQATSGTVKVKDINGDLGKTIVTAKTLTSTGTVTLKGSESVMTLTGTTADAAASSINGLALSDGAKASAVDLTLTDTSNTGTAATIGNGSNLDVTGTLTTNRDIVVGSATSGEAGATVSIAKLDLKGKGLFVDPAWGQQSANVAVGDFTTTATPNDVKINGDIGVGMNSLLAVGTTDKTWLAGKVAEMGGLSENGIGAALGLKTAQVIGDGFGLVVDGTKTNADFTSTAPTDDTANFAKDSLLIVSSDAATSANGALSFADAGGGKAVIQDGAKLRIADAKVNQTYKVLGTGVAKEYINAAGTVITGGHTGWTGSNLSTDSNMVLLNQNADGTFGTTMASATGIFHGMSDQMGKIVEKMYGSNLHDPHSSNAGIRFASRATMPDYLSADQAAATIEGAAQLAVVGAAPAMTLSAVQAGTSTVTTRTSFASPLMDSSKAVALHKDVDGTLSVDSGLNAGNGMKNGFGLWIMPLYQSNSAWGMKADGFKGGYKSDLGGVALGADYTFNDMFRLGLAFNIGGGYAESNGDFNKTENSFNFWGINAYGGWTMNNFGITADVGYTGNYNKLQQELPSGMGMSDIKSDVNSSAWTAGLRGEYKFQTEALDIIPHVGVRYTGLTTDEYKAKSGGDTVFKVDQDFQSIWTFPIGVTLAKEIETGSGWIIRPQVDLGITPATGDVKAKSKVRIPGVDAQAEMKMQVVDYMSYDGGVGLEMKKDNISFGINYNIQASEHRTGHGVFGTFRYEF